jgi:glycopeptide antibiotics resistance protein
MFNSLYPSIIIISFFLLFFGYKFIKDRISVMHFFYWIIFSVYVASLVVYTLFPFPYQKELIEIMIEDNLGVHHNFIPFKAFVDAINMGSLTIAVKQIGGNILLFMPLGFALPILFPAIKKGKVILTGFLVSLTIELVQAIAGMFLGYNYRSFDVDDLMMNTLGTVIGLLIFNLLARFSQNSGLLINKETKI